MILISSGIQLIDKTVKTMAIYAINLMSLAYLLT